MERYQALLNNHPTTKSHFHSNPVKVTFTNDTSETISIYWLDYNGEEVVYSSELQSGGNFFVRTYITHPWIFKNSLGESMFVMYAEKIVSHFEALGYMMDQYSGNRITQNEFRSLFNGRGNLSIKIVSQPTLSDMCSIKISRILHSLNLQLEPMRERLENLELPKILRDKIIEKFVKLHPEPSALN